MDLPVQSFNTPGEGDPRRIKVLMYHRIVRDEGLGDTSWLLVPVKRFRRQLELMERWGFTAITFEDYRLFLAGELNLPKKPVILTFDDGYADTFEMAYPLLQEFGMKAVVFVLGDRTIRTNFWDKPLGLPEAPLMTDEQILEMHAAGFEIGAHSMTHARLTQLPDDLAWREIAHARTALEQVIHGTVQSFCYPYELVDERIKTMVKQAGYLAACGVGSGPPVIGEDMYEIRRIAIRNTTGVIEFGLKVRTPYHYYEWGRRKTRRYLERHHEPSFILDPARHAEKTRPNRFPASDLGSFALSGVEQPDAQNGNGHTPLPLTVEIVESLEQFIALQGRWNAIAQASSATVFQTFDWAFLWWKHFGAHPGRTLHILTFRFQHTVVGIAPFFLEVRTFAGMRLYRRLRVIGGPVSIRRALVYDPSDYLDVIGLPEFRSDIAVSLAVYLKQYALLYDEVAFENAPHEGFVVKDLAPQLPLHGFQYTIARSTVCPRLSTPTSLDVFLAGRHADARHRLSQTRNTFCDNAVCTLDTVDSPDALMNGFHALVALHQDRWNRLGFPGLFFHARCVQFHREVAQRFFERGWLWFKIMRLEDAPIAARMGFVFNNCIYDYLSGFDDQSPAARRRPGLALLLGMIEDAIRWRCTAVDLLRGDESYKFDLTSEVDYNWSVGLFNSDTCRTLRVRLYRLLSRGNAIVHRIAKEWLLFRVSQRAYGFPGCLARYSEFRLHRLARKMRHSMAEPFHRRLATTGRALKQRLLTGIDTMRYPVLHRIIRGLERDYELPLTWKIRKGLVFLRSMLLAKLYLRKCQEVGHRARTRGKPYIDNIGQIHIGDDFHLNSRIVRSELATGHKGCIKIGDEVTINFGASICAQKLVKIGNRVRIGPYATIMDSDFHALDERDSRPSGIPTVIEDDVWLAGRVTVLKGTRIGRGTVITAGSVVSGIIPPGVIAGGVPARVIRSVKQPEEPKPSRKAATDKSRQVDETQVVERVTAVITEMFGVDGEIDSSWGPGNIVSWDSLGHLNLMSRLEKMFNVTFSDDDMVRMTTIQGICDTIVRCVARSLRPDRTGGEEVLAEHPRHRQP